MSLRTILLCIIAVGSLFEQCLAQPLVQSGRASYYSTVPPGLELPSNSTGAPISPVVGQQFSGPVPTNTWWSSLVWHRYPNSSYGQPMHPHPLSVRAEGAGLWIASVQQPIFTPTDYFFELSDPRRGLRIGLAGLSNAALRVERAGDWNVTTSWSSGGARLTTTFGRGMPFVYAEATGADALVTFNTVPGAVTVWANRGRTIGVTIGGVPYGIFGPSGSTWTLTPTQARSSLAGRGYFSVAALPDATAATLDLFESRAFAFVTDTRVSWQYQQATSRVDATFSFLTTPREGTQTTPLIALYRHQWRNTSTPRGPSGYPTSRGFMKLADASTFTASLPMHGLIPVLPETGALTDADLHALVNAQYTLPILGGGSDTYGAGRTYAKVELLADLAAQAGHEPARQRFVTFLRDELSEWFRVGAASSTRSVFTQVEAESFDQSQGVTVAATPTGSGVFEIGGGDFLRFNALDFTTASPANRLLLMYSSVSGGSGLFQMRVDAPNGPVIAEGGIGSNGGEWNEVALGLTPAASSLTGLHDVYITCDTPYPGEIFRLDWFRLDRAGAPQDRFFAYHAPWSTLLGYPGSFGSIGELNDHHFHYGYFIHAAATLARLDPTWASQNQFGGMVELLIKDAANDDRADLRFPFLRSIDPYGGFSYASGHAGFGAGNNQESSSEAINFASGVALWGAATRNNRLRDLGLFLFASESAAIREYWFDADNEVFPAAAPRKIAGIVWDSGAAYGTFFSAAPEHIHGISLLPITSSNLHLGARADMVQKGWNLMVQRIGGPPTLWQAVHRCAQALFDPAAAEAWLNANPNFEPEAPETKAQMVHWIKTMARVGLVDPTITADHPHYAVFIKNGVRTYAAWNPSTTPLSVRFSNGFTMCVEPGAHSVTTTPSTCPCLADFNSDGAVDGDDVIAFFFAWDTGQSDADVTGDDATDGDDVILFFERWDAGC